MDFGNYRIDLHIHTSLASACSVLSPDALLEWLENSELDGVCITEHDTISGALSFKKLALHSQKQVYVGMEISHHTGAHILTYNFFEEGDFYNLPLEELIENIHNKGGIAVLAHPFRHGFEPNFLEDKEVLKLFDAIEVLNGNCNQQENQAAFDLAEQLGLHKVAGSDAHSIDMLGKYYTHFNNLPKNEAELADLIKSGEGRVALC